VFGNDGRYALIAVRCRPDEIRPGHRPLVIVLYKRSTFHVWDTDVQRHPFTIDGDRLICLPPGSFGYGGAARKSVGTGTGTGAVVLAHRREHREHMNRG
jgi:hypothetical protein